MGQGQVQRGKIGMVHGETFTASTNYWAMRHKQVAQGLTGKREGTL